MNMTASTKRIFAGSGFQNPRRLTTMRNRIIAAVIKTGGFVRVLTTDLKNSITSPTSVRKFRHLYERARSELPSTHWQQLELLHNAKRKIVTTLQRQRSVRLKAQIGHHLRHEPLQDRLFSTNSHRDLHDLR